MHIRIHTWFALWDVENTAQVNGGICTVVQGEARLVVSGAHKPVELVVLLWGHFLGVHQPYGLNVVGLLPINLDWRIHKAAVLLDHVWGSKRENGCS